MHQKSVVLRAGFRVGGRHQDVDVDASAAAGYRYDEVRLGCRWVVLSTEFIAEGYLAEQDEADI